jgi:hypothetical protein
MGGRHDPRSQPMKHWRAADGRNLLPRRFALHRYRDSTGVSGTGIVAYGTVYLTGLTTLAWCAGDITSVTVYDSPDHVTQVHGHGGSTRLVWIDGDGQSSPRLPSDGASAQVEAGGGNRA